MSNYVQGSLWKQCLEVDFVNVRKTERFPTNLTPPHPTTTKHNNKTQHLFLSFSFFTFIIDRNVRLKKTTVSLQDEPIIACHHKIML